MIPPIRVLVVDDSVVARRILADGMSADARVEVLRPARSGETALQRLETEAASVVVLDVEMPGMNGLETLVELRRRHPDLPVIMFSALTECGARTTIDALTLGASDYLAKPGTVAGGLLPEQTMALLIEKVVALGAGAEACTVQGVRRPATDERANKVGVLAIGVSTGGPNALVDLLPRLPGSLPVPVLIVQHMPPMFTRLLAERLDAKCELTVRECTDTVAPRAGEVWIAPGGRHMVVARGAAGVQLELGDGPPENSCRPAVDVLFRSVAEIYSAGALALVLTGMGQDGGRGAEAIVGAGGRVLVQDEATSVVWGMPGYVAKAGLASAVLPLPELAPEVVRRIGVGRVGCVS